MSKHINPPDVHMKRRSLMNAHASLNPSKELGKRISCEALLSIISLFPHHFNKPKQHRSMHARIHLSHDTKIASHRRLCLQMPTLHHNLNTALLRMSTHNFTQNIHCQIIYLNNAQVDNAVYQFYASKQF